MKQFNWTQWKPYCKEKKTPNVFTTIFPLDKIAAKSFWRKTACGWFIHSLCLCITSQATSTCIHQPVYINLYTSTCIHQPVYTNLYTSTRIHQPVYINPYTPTCMHQPVCINLYTSTCIHQPVCINLYTSTCIHQPVYINPYTSTRIHQPVYTNLYTSRINNFQEKRGTELRFMIN